MTKKETIQKLKDRLEAEKKAYEEEGRPNYVRLNRTMFLTVTRRQAQISRKIYALQAAIELLTKPLRDIDVHEAVLMSISVRNDQKEELLWKAESVYFNERKEALRAVFETSLPFLKKQVIGYL